MKKLLALLLAASMVLTLTACGEEDDKKDSSKNNNSSSQEDNSTDSESKDDESKEEDSKDDDSKEEDSKDDSSTPEGMQTINVDGFTMDIPDTWTTQTINSINYYSPTDTLSTGISLNVISTSKDPAFKLYTSDIFADQLKAIYADINVTVDKFEYSTIDGYDAFETVYSIDLQNQLSFINQYCIDGSDKTYIITFSGYTGDFEDNAIYTGTIKID